MKKIVLLIAIMIAINPLNYNAKGNYNYENQLILGGSNSDDLSSVKKVSDGYILVGRTSSNDGDFLDNNPRTKYDMYTMKLDNNLNIVWQERMGLNKPGTYAKDVIETKDNGVVVVGQLIKATYSDFSDSFRGQGDAFIVKYDKDGNKLWDHLYGGADSENFNSIVEDKNGDLIAVGGVYKYASYDYDILATKYSSDGDLLEEKLIGGSENEIARSIVKSNDGSIIILADSASHDGDINLPTTIKKESTLFIQIDEKLEIESIKNYGDLDGNFPAKIKQTADGGYAVTTSWRISGSMRFGGSLAYKFDKDFNIVWDKTIEHNEGSANNIVQTADGGYLVSGTTLGDDDIDDAFHGTGNSDALLTKLDASGNIEWQDIYGSNDKHDGMVYAEQSDDGKYIVFGYTYGDDGDIVKPVYGYGDIFISKFNNIPKIDAQKEETISKYDVKTDKELIELFKANAFDEEDKDLTNEIVVDQSAVDYNNIGSYNVNFYIKDHSGIAGNEASVDATLNVVDGKPTLSANAEESVHVYNSMDDAQLKDLFNVQAIDAEDGDLTKDITVDQSAVDYDKVGTYDIEFKVKDSGLNEDTINSKLNVINDKPIIKADSEKYSPVGKVISDEALKLMFNMSASDTEDGDITSKVKMDSSSIDFNKEGDYNIIFEVADSLGETVSKTVILHISNEKPTIDAKDLVKVNVGTHLNKRELKQIYNVSASDKEDGDITSKVKVDSSSIDFNKVGTYEIKFSVKDSNGNLATKTSSLEVKAKVKGDDEGEYKKLSTTGSNMLVISSISIIGLYVIKRVIYN